MWKHSHYIVASRIADICDLGKMQSYALKWGSIIPDMKPSCFLKPHTYQNWRGYTNKLLLKLTDSRKGIIYFYNFGKLLHFYADFFTKPHNSDNLHDFLDSHVKWERELDKQTTKLFTLSCNINSDSLKDLRKSYNKQITVDSSVALDLEYIQTVCYYLCLEVGLLKCSKISMNSENLIVS